MLKRHIEFHPAIVPAIPQPSPVWCIACQEGNIACDYANPCQPCSRAGKVCIRTPVSHTNEPALRNNDHLETLLPPDINIDMTLTADDGNDHRVEAGFLGSVERHHTYGIVDIPQFFAHQHHRQSWQLDSSAMVGPDTGFSNQGSMPIVMADQPYMDEQSDAFRSIPSSRNERGERRNPSRDSGVQDGDWEHRQSAANIVTTLAQDAVPTPSTSQSQVHSGPPSEVSSVQAPESADYSSEPSSVTSLSSRGAAESRPSLQDFIAKNYQSVTDLLRTFFTQVHQYWPILHAPNI